MFAAVRWSGDRKWTAGGAKRDGKGTAASREWMSDNQGYGESPEIELVRRAWDALIQGGPEALGEVLAADAQCGTAWRTGSVRAAKQSST